MMTKKLKFVGLSSLLQNRNLPGVVKIVLDHAMKRDIDRRHALNNRLIEPGIVEAANRFVKFTVNGFEKGLVLSGWLMKRKAPTGKC